MNKPSYIKIIILAVFSLVLVSAIGFAGFYYYNYSFNAGNKTVADFHTMNKEEIEQYLIDNSIKSEYVVFEEEYSDEIPVGYVISQSIKPDEGKYKEILTIVISKGEDPDSLIELPDITNLMQNDIMEWFDNNGFTNVTYQFIVPEDADLDIPYGKVIAISKLGLAKRNDSIVVTLADLVEEIEEENNTESEKDDEYVDIPDFQGYTIKQFAEWTHGHGLKYYVYEKYSDTYEKGYVISQSPAASGKAKKGSTVTLTMSLGKAKKMDNLVGKTKTDADKFATENNVKIKYLEEYSKTIEKGKIISTDPKAGIQYYEGDTITVTVSKGSDVIKLNGSYVDKTEKSLKDAVLSLYASASFDVSSRYSDKASGNIISHDSEVSLVNKFKYTVSLGQYTDSNTYSGKSVNDVKTVITNANNKGAGLNSLVTSSEITKDSSLDNKIKSCTFANKTYSCVVYKYEEPKSSFIAADFKDYPAGNATYSKDGNTYHITVVRTYTGYNNETPDTFNSATSSDGVYIKEGSTVTVYINKGPEPLKYGDEIQKATYNACQMPTGEATYELIETKVINVLMSLRYTRDQIRTIPTSEKLIGHIDMEQSSLGKFVIGTDIITVYIGSGKLD